MKAGIYTFVFNTVDNFLLFVSYLLVWFSLMCVCV